jgi:hypothetical protein
MENEYYSPFDEDGVTTVLEEDRSYVGVESHGDSLSFNEYCSSEDMTLSMPTVSWLIEEGLLEPTKTEFNSLANTWKAQTDHLSNVTMKCMHPAYQRIIGMGKTVVPLILNDLKATQADWFWALSAITGQNPISEQDAGYVDRMTEAWLRWGKSLGYDV